MLRRTSMVFLAAMVLVSSACDDIDALRREKQIKTYWRLTRAGLEIQELSRTQPLTAKSIGDVVTKHFSNNRDLWGNPIVVITKGTETRVDSYVLVSFGSDGQPDLEEDQYFEVKPHSVRRSASMDLIVRDGEPISLAGK